MARWALGTALVLVTLALAACAQRRIDPKPRAPAVPAPSAAPEAPRERHDAPEPPSKDPSIKPPPGYRKMAVGGVAPTPEGEAVVLLDDDARTGLVIYVGGTEALSIALRLEHRRPQRPTTHDLVDTVARRLGGAVVAAQVDRVDDDVFYGSVLISKAGHLLDVDARPSDALAIALGDSVPVYVAESVIKQAGIDVDRFDFRRFVAEPKKKSVRAHPDEVEL